MKLFKKKHPKRPLTLIILVAVIAAVVSFGIAYGLQSNRDKTSGQASCNGTCVALRKDKADPETLAVGIGSFVQFNSADGKTHDLSLGGGGKHHEHKGKFQSGEFGADEAWRVQFNDEGSYFFHDHLNPKLNVLVVVYMPGKDHTIR